MFLIIKSGTMMSDDAVNITGTHPPRYSKGDVFVISGLINPTLVVPNMLI